MQAATERYGHTFLQTMELFGVGAFCVKGFCKTRDPVISAGHYKPSIEGGAFQRSSANPALVSARHFFVTHSHQRRVEGTVPSIVFAARSLIAIVLLQDSPAAEFLVRVKARATGSNHFFVDKCPYAPSPDCRRGLAVQLLYTIDSAGVKWPNEFSWTTVNGPARRINMTSRGSGILPGAPQV
jgi:hypothetical protein